MSGGLLTGTGAWEVDGNWSSAAKPVDNDLAEIPDSMGNNITDSTGAAKGVDLDLLHTHSKYKGSFGASGAPIRTAADLVYVQGCGPFYFECHKDVAELTDEVRVECSVPSAPVVIGSDPAVGDEGDITRIHFVAGNLTLSGNIKFTDSGGIVVCCPDPSDAQSQLKIVSTADTLPDFVQNAGRAFVDNIVTRLAISGGVCTKATNKAATIDVFKGGTLIYNHAAQAGDVTICRVHTGAVLDLLQNGSIKVFDKVIRFRGGVIKKLTKLHTFTEFVDLEVEG